MPDVARPRDAANVDRAAGNTENTQAAILAEADHSDRRIAKLRSRAALAGFSLHELAGGAWLLGRSAFVRELPDLRAVDLVLRSMEASHA